MSDGGSWVFRNIPSIGLVEFDVTRARQILHQQKAQSGQALSFSAFILACLR